MNNFSSVCITCSTIVNDYAQATSIDSSINIIHNMLFICFPELYLTPNQNKIVCKKCFEDIKILYQFKNQCWETEKRINKYKDSIKIKSNIDNSIKVYLQIKQEITEDLKVINTNVNFHQTCRTCLLSVEASQPISTTSNIKQISIHDILYLCCSELDLRNNSNAVLCGSCFEIIRIINHFIFQCNKSIEKERESTVVRRSVQNLRTRGDHNFKEEIKSEDIDLSDTESCLSIKSTNSIVTHSENLQKFNFKSCPIRTIEYGNDIKLRLPTGKKLFKCPQCVYSVSQISILKQHVYIHFSDWPFKCTQCSYSSKDEQSLKIHACTHTSKKPYKCAFCCYSSAQNRCLKQHILIHTGEKTFKH